MLAWHFRGHSFWTTCQAVPLTPTFITPFTSPQKPIYCPPIYSQLCNSSLFPCPHVPLKNCAEDSSFDISSSLQFSLIFPHSFYPTSLKSYAQESLFVRLLLFFTPRYTTLLFDLTLPLPFTPFPSSPIKLTNVASILRPHPCNSRHPFTRFLPCYSQESRTIAIFLTLFALPP